MMKTHEAKNIFTLLKTAYHLYFSIEEEKQWIILLEKFGDFEITRERLERYILSGYTEAPTMAHLLSKNILVGLVDITDKLYR